MGDNVYLGDRNGVRTPMQWSADRNAGFSKVNPQRCYLPVILDPEYHYEAINVEAQEANPQSLLWWTKRLIALRREHPVLGFGDITFLYPENPKVLAFLRCWKGQHCLIVANMSRHPQHVELDLTGHAGKTPVEMIGRTRFPPISDRPYGLTFGPHMFLWFELEVAAPETRTRTHLTAVDTWTTVTENRRALARALEDYAATRRWFRGKARTRRRARILDLFDLPAAHGKNLLVMLEIEYSDGEPETYLIPIGFLQGEPAVHLEARSAHAVIASVEVTGREAARGVLYDTLATGEGAQALLGIARAAATLPGVHGRLIGAAEPALRDAADEPSARVIELEQTNSTVPFGDRWIIKVFRQAEPGENAELEIGRYLTTRPEVRVPPVLGSVAYQREGEEAAAVAVVHQLVANQGTAWDLFSGELDKLFETTLAASVAPPETTGRHILELVAVPAPAVLAERAGHYLRHAALLGRRTGEVHVALGQGRGPAFAAERYTVMYQQSLFQGARGMMVRTFELLSKRLSKLPEDVQDAARAALMAQAQIEERLRAIQSRPLEAIRMRVHGDLHLGQVLFTGDDFVLIDFEGEPARPLRERRYKRNPLRDVAGMIRSFGYASESALRSGAIRPQDQDKVRPWGVAWHTWVSAAYLTGYLEVVPAPLVPADPAVLKLILDFHRMEKCIYEIGYELNNRPDWLPIPVRGLLDLIR
jgi:maltose alpha-D-glucosyltransferase/alpha-amylase